MNQLDGIENYLMLSFGQTNSISLQDMHYINFDDVSKMYRQYTNQGSCRRTLL